MADTPTRTRGWRHRALLISIVLNLFLAALIVGHVLHHRQALSQEESPLAHALANAEASLPARDKPVFRQVVQRDMPDYAEAARRLVAARNDVERQIAAEPFQADAVRQALTRWRAAWNGFFDAFSGTLIDALGRISPEGRRSLIAERERVRAGLASRP